MGIFDPQTVGTTGSSVTTTRPPFVEQGFAELADRAFALGDRPYTPYPGPRIAPFSGLQQQAFGLAEANVGQAGRFAEEGIGQVRSGLAGPSAAGIQQYMNPFQEQVTQNTLREMGRQNTIGGIMDSARAVQQGAFGGSRSGIVEAERARNFGRTSADFIAQSNAQNYGQALNQFNTQQQLRMQGGQQIAGLGGLQQQFQQQDINNLIGLGGVQQAQTQGSLDLAYGDFQRQLRYPYEQISYVSDLIGGVPSSQQTSVSQQQAPGPSIGSQIAGLGISAVGLLGATGAFGQGGYLNFGS